MYVQRSWLVWRKRLMTGVRTVRMYRSSTVPTSSSDVCSSAGASSPNIDRTSRPSASASDRCSTDCNSTSRVSHCSIVLAVPFCFDLLYSELWIVSYSYTLSRFLALCLRSVVLSPIFVVRKGCNICFRIFLLLVFCLCVDLTLTACLLVCLCLTSSSTNYSQSLLCLADKRATVVHTRRTRCSQRAQTSANAAAVSRRSAVAPSCESVYIVSCRIWYCSGQWTSDPRSTSGFGLTPTFNYFWRVSPCPCLLCLVDVRKRVRELSCIQSIQNTQNKPEYTGPDHVPPKVNQNDRQNERQRQTAPAPWWR